MSLKNSCFALALSLSCFLQILDGFMTHNAVNSNLVQEANWLVEDIVSGGSFPLVKICGAFFCAVVLWFLYKRFPNLTLLTTSLVVVFYGMVITWNLHILSTI